MCDARPLNLFACIVQGGTASSSAHLNDRNEQDPANFWSDLSRCDFLVTLAGTDSIPSSGALILDFHSLFLDLIC